MQAAAAVLCACTEGVGVSAQNAVRPPTQHFSTRDVSVTVTAPRHTAPYDRMSPVTHARHMHEEC